MRSIYPLVFSVLFILFAAIPGRAQVLEQDSLALVAIYNATDGPNWRSDPEWLDRPVRDWGYLDVDGDRVVGLGLAQLDLKGSLPPEIGNLTALRSLGLEMNQLTGPIPEEIGNLTELEYLSMYRNQFSGPVPASIGNLTKLGDLIIWGNQLTSLPEEIGNLVGLTQLIAWENKITNIPQRIGDMVNLIIINLSSNEISTPIPSSIGNLTNLQELDLSYNADMSGPIPSTIGNLWRLRRLYAYDSGLSGPLPTEIGGLISLERLGIARANLEGPLPSTLGDLKSLTDLSLSNNQITGPIPPEMGEMTGLEDILLFGNQLSGEIPSELGNLEKVYSITLQDNELEGAIPASLANMSALRSLNVENNNIEDLADFKNTPQSNFSLRVKGNRLHFDDLQLNDGVNLGTYWPQQEIDVYPTDMGSEWVLACGVGGTGNSYQWFYEDRSGASNNSQTSTLVVPKPVNNRYYCEAKNSSFVELILTTWLWPESSGGGNQAPTAAFTASSTSGTAPFAVSFDASGSSDPEGSSLTYAWDFGDGATGSGVNSTHTFTTAGTYSVTLTVSDTDGASDSISVDIEVQDPTNSDVSHLVGLWLGEDETGFDESGTGHNGFWIGNPEVLTDPDYPDHEDLYLDGFSAVQIPDASDLVPSEVTVGLRFRLDDLEGIQMLASHSVTGSSSNAGWYVAVIGDAIGLGLETADGSVVLAPSDLALSAETWYSLAFTVGAGQVHLYLDGIAIASASSGAILDPDADLFLGAGADYVTSLGGGLKGFLDGVWIDDLVYSAEEIRSAQGLDGEEHLPTDLLVWYPFNGTAEEMVSGEETTGVTWTDGPFGLANNAMYLPEGWQMWSDAYTVSDTPSDEISFGGWFRRDSGGSLNRQLVKVGGASSGSGFTIWGPSPVDGVGFEIRIRGENGTTDIDARTGVLFDYGNWFHLFSTHDGTNHRVYVNGMLALTGGETAVGPFVARSAGENITFGANNSGAYADFRVYNRAISAEEILELAYPSRGLTETSTVDKSQAGEVFSAQAGGYLFGTNGYADLAKAELMSLPSGKAEGTLAGVRLWMGHSWDADGDPIPQGDAYLRIWSGNSSAGPQQLIYDSPALALVTTEKEFTYEDPEVVGPIPIFLALPNVTVPTDFFVAVHFEPYGNDVDKYALMSSQTVGAAVPGVWEMWENGQWASVSSAWFGGSDGAHLWIDIVEAVDATGVAVEEPEDVVLPTGVVLHPAYPNPFNPTTNIEFDLPVRGPVRVSVIDILGREVSVLVDGILSAGRHQSVLDASAFASGVYIVRMQAGRTVDTQSIVLLK